MFVDFFLYRLKVILWSVNPVPHGIFHVNKDNPFSAYLHEGKRLDYNDMNDHLTLLKNDWHICPSGVFKDPGQVK